MAVDNTTHCVLLGEKQAAKSPAGLRIWDYFKHGIELMLVFEVTTRATKNLVRLPNKL